MAKIFNYGEDSLTVEIALDLVSGKQKGVITPQTREKVHNCYQEVQKIANGDKLVYAINTGFGSLCTTRISKKDVNKLQENLLKSHSVGVGDAIPFDTAKLMLILKLQSLCMGYSGVSEAIVDRIVWHINENYIPLVPEQGSVGASGDLAPLSHLFLPLIGLGKLQRKDLPFKDTRQILNQAGLSPIALGPKEGLALINGTQFMAAFGVMITHKLKSCLDHADIIGAMSVEGLLGSAKPFVKRLHQIRPHQGAITVAKRLSALLEDSGFMAYHAHCDRVQDPYSLRCMPQVHGASRDACLHLKQQVECEINSVTDNPVIFSADDAVSGGNFHGQPIALPMDYAGLAASELGNISDRRSYLLLEGKIELPIYLIKNSGVNSGLMIAQYCSAALASENKSLCFPASADSIPTSLGQEDHVSMGSISGRKTLRIIDNLEKILSVEMLCAAQAIDFRRPNKSSIILETCLEEVRKQIPHIEEDLEVHQLINQSLKLIQSGKLLELTSNLD
ncbi:MAG: histidine ammonia-lyase [Deltaproteobacteria bacterium]|jgi:histidine ammonia-lyase|nr:histidine ammonia-lyase [Deltaproteobacteria bacterium]MBT4525897.1 histidine ammonia-lyase [Deltaproteobacteria bacterium]